MSAWEEYRTKAEEFRELDDEHEAAAVHGAEARAAPQCSPDEEPATGESIRAISAPTARAAARVRPAVAAASARSRARPRLPPPWSGSACPSAADAGPLREEWPAGWPRGGATGSALPVSAGSACAVTHTGVCALVRE